MLVIPAIDIRKGRCVRLVQGEAERETVFSDDPALVAARWEALGAPILHVVDLDGAFEGRPSNREVVGAIIRRIGVPVQFGGGLRTAGDIKGMFSLGVSRVVLGTAAVKDRGLLQWALATYPGRVLVGIDARDRWVAVKGWTENTVVPALDLAREVLAMGVRQIVYTDIKRDGTLVGPNFQGIEEMLASGLELIASGGVSSLEDLRRLRLLEERGVTGVIIGRALYTGAVSLEQALAVAGGEQ